MALGNCTRCGNPLAVVQRNKFRVVGDTKVLLADDGSDLRQDDRGRLTGQPALECVVQCGDCGREAHDHPYQKELNEAVAKAKVAPPPNPPKFLDTKYTEVNGFDDVNRRMTAIEAQIALLVHQQEKIMDELHGFLQAVKAAEQRKSHRGKKEESSEGESAP